MKRDHIETAWVRWRAKMLQLTTKFVPKRHVCSTIKPRPWVSEELRQSIHLKHSLYKKFKQVKTPEIWENFRKKRNTVSKQLKEVKCWDVMQLGDTVEDTVTTKEKRSESRMNMPRLHNLFRMLTKNSKS